MTFKELKNASRRIRSAALLESFAPRKLRRALKEILVLMAPVVIILSMFFAEEAHLTLPRLYGILFLLIFLWFVLFAIDSFFYSMYFKGVHTTIPERGFSKKTHKVSFEVLYIALNSDPEDVTAGFINSPAGESIFSRLDIDKKSADAFLASRKNHTKGTELIFPGEPTLAAYAGTLYDADQELVKFLSGFGFRRADLVGAADWVSRIFEAEKLRLRWWSRDSLGRVRGIGKEWSHGETYHLERYGKYLKGGKSALGEGAYKKEITALERVLLRTKGAGALVVGESNDEALEVVYGLAEDIASGTVLPHLEHKRIFHLDSAAFVSATDSKTDFEKEFINILEEALRAEHIIFVIPNFASFISDAKYFDVDVLEILAPYLRASGLQIVALSDKDDFIDHLQKNTDLMSKFEKILVSGHEMEAVLHVLEEKVAKIERETKLFFTYPALVSIATGAERYFSDSSVVDKMSDLLAVLVSKAPRGQKRIIKSSDIADLIKVI